MSKLKRIPKFKTEDEEREFWSTHDSTEYVDYSKVKKVLLPGLKPSTRSISIRLPESLISLQISLNFSIAGRYYVHKSHFWWMCT